jgi:hypothetical protein
MLTYAKLQTRPATFRALTGLTPAEFERLYQDVQREYEAAEDRRLGRPNRQRRRGAGRKFSHGLADRLLLPLVWLRLYPTYAVLSVLFGLDQSTICRRLQGSLPLLAAATWFDLQWPADARRKQTWPELLGEFPEVECFIDATEQRIRRPKGADVQQPHYSGKKKAHTLKTQIGTAPDGEIREVSASVPGSTHDLTLLRQTGTLARLTSGKAMMDAGYQGIRNDVPPERVEHPFRASRGHPLTDAQKAANRVLAKVRIKIEHTFGSLKIFQVLAQVYRHRRDQYHRCFCIVAGLTNRRLGFGRPVVG